MQRREFVSLGVAGAATLLGQASVSVGQSKAQTIAEPVRQVPVVGKAQVIVCGAGPAGVAAAVASARKGAKTDLLEVHGCLGGIWTAGALSVLLDHQNKSGLMLEILQRLDRRAGRGLTRRGTATNIYDVEVMKLVLEELCEEAGVSIRLHTRVSAVVRGNEGRLSHVITESKSGREAWQGDVVIDATGDGDLAALAGCRYDVGNPHTGRCQPMTLMAIVTGIQAADVAGFFRDEDHPSPWATPKDKLRIEMERGGHSPSYAKPSLFRLRDDCFALMANHQYGVQATSADDLTRATLAARKEIHALVDGLRSLGGVWKNLRIVATAEQIGVREGRRIHGLYTVTADDLREGRRHADAVCRVTFPVDVHATDPAKEKGIEKAGFKTLPYDIPLRALIAADAANLMMAGRCISGDFLAHASYRVTGNAVATGEAAGKTAAAAAKTSRLPKAVPFAEIA